MGLINILTLLPALAWAQCPSSTLEFPITSDMGGLRFVGFNPTVSRFSGGGMGNKIVLKNYAYEPVSTLQDDVMVISAGGSCTATVNPTASPVAAMVDPSATPSTAPLAAPVASSAYKFAVTTVFGLLTGSPLVSAIALVGASFMAADAQSSCTESIDVEIYTDANQIIAQEYKAGEFEECPPESLYWKHHPNVYGGYEGCVGEKGLVPCAESQGYDGESLYNKYPTIWNHTLQDCQDTGYTYETRTFWILWGDPLDKTELVIRTGLNPTVTFPFIRGPYPRYSIGSQPEDRFWDDSMDARMMAKDLMLYIEAFTETELEEFTTTMTEGAESGMVGLRGAMALSIARTTCNRNIYALMEGPAYGYSNGDSAMLANKFSSSFYNGEECLCYLDDSCLEPTVTISNAGWVPNTPLPTALGGNNITYSADSASPASPFFESMVFPENPSGKMKVPQIPNSDRRVCDGVYLWPMYFGMEGYKIPIDKRPDCVSWSFSITKAYSASVRAGNIMYKNGPQVHFDSVVDVFGQILNTMTNGLYSQWSWQGQMQLWEMIMSKPYTDPTSWVGAYGTIMNEKWDAVIDGFANCPVVTITNPKAGAYAFFFFNEPYWGVQTSGTPSFFLDVLGVQSTTYSWGWRGANPADYYGEGVGFHDFTRMQLYRDLNVYTEVARRAKIVCADTTASIGDFMSIDEWVAASSTRANRRLHESTGQPLTRDERKLSLKETVPRLSESQLDMHVTNIENRLATDEKVEACAPDYTTTCLFDAIGTRNEDY